MWPLARLSENAPGEAQLAEAGLGTESSGSSRSAKTVGTEHEM